MSKVPVMPWRVVWGEVMKMYDSSLKSLKDKSTSPRESTPLPKYIAQEKLTSVTLGWGRKEQLPADMYHIRQLRKQSNFKGSFISESLKHFFHTCDIPRSHGHFRGPWTWLTELDGHHKTRREISHCWDILRHHCSGKCELEIEKSIHALLCGCLEGINAKYHGWGPRQKPALQKETFFACAFSACPPSPFTQGNGCLFACM